MLRDTEGVAVTPAFRRALLFVVAALVSVLLVAVPLGQVPMARSYVPAEFEPNSGAEASLTAQLENRVQDGGEVGPGKVIVYDGTVSYSPPSDYQPTAQSDIEDTLRIRFAPSAQTSNWPDPNALSVTLTDANGVPYSGATIKKNWMPSGNNPVGYEINISGIDEPVTIKIEATATLPASLADGATFIGNLDAEMGTTVLPQLTGENPTFVPDNKGIYDCSGTMVFNYEAVTGGWLVDLKFGDAKGKGKVIPDRVPLVDGSENETSKNSIKVTGPDGENLTPKVLGTTEGYAKPVYNRDDSSKPYRTSSIAAMYPNTRWVDSLNWPYDPSTYTGSTWIPAGTKIVIKRHVNYGNCVGPGLSSDGTIARPLAANLAIARPNLTASASDQAVIQAPGEPVVAGCEGIYAYRQTTSGDVGRVMEADLQEAVKSNGANPPIQVTDIGQLGKRTEGAAVSSHPKLEGKHYYFENTKSDTKSPWLNAWKEPYGPTSYLPRLKDQSGVAISGAIDATGKFWTVVVDYGGHGNVHYIDLTDNSPEWKKAGTVSNVVSGSGQPGTTHDIAFQADGSMLLIVYKGGSIGINEISVNGMKRLKSNTNAAVRANLKYSIPTGASSAYGIAVGTDGMIYFSEGSSISAINPANGVVTRKLATWGWAVISDMASCTPIPVEESKFKVQKSVIDPETKQVMPAGTAADNMLKLDDNNRGYVDYVITVSNIGSKYDTHEVIKDSISFPHGFTITGAELDGVALDSALIPNFEIPAAGLQAGEVEQHTLRVYLKAEEDADWLNAGECKTDGPGDPSKGLFNWVRMGGDSDGVDNNDACVPVEPKETAHLKLVKEIVGQNGDVITGTGHEQLFKLVAAGPTSLVGVSGSDDVNKDVYVGKYKLDEIPDPASEVSATYKELEWSCVEGINQTPKTITAEEEVIVESGEDVTCTVQNKRAPLFHTVKVATNQDPDIGNPHVGSKVTLDPDTGAGLLKYTIKVKSDSDFKGHTGPVTERFLMPKGLVWDDSKSAEITYRSNGTGATAEGVPATASKSQVVEGFEIAKSIKNLGPRKEVEFDIVIPVKADLEADEDGNVPFVQNAEDLGTCESLKTSGNTPYVGKYKGAVNSVSLDDENMTYNDAPILDNYACIPVEMPPKWSVKKAVFDTEKSTPSELSWAEAGTTGPAITLEKLDGGELKGTIFYKVTVTNEGKVAAKHPFIEDRLTLPKGFELETFSRLIGQQESAVDWTEATNGPGNGKSYDFKIPEGEDLIKPGKSTSYTYKVIVKAGQTSNINWDLVGTCDTEGAGTPEAGGFFNRVTMEGDSDGDHNNDACVPAYGPGKPITIIKKDGANTELDGAQFVIYPDENGSIGEVPLEGNNPVPDLNGNTDPSTVGSKFETTELEIGKTYWLKETRAPYTTKLGDAGYSLLAEPLKFTMKANGVEVEVGDQTISSDGQTVTVDNNTFEITGLEIVVHDPRIAELPKAGGLGLGWPTVVGLLLIAGGVVGTIQRDRFAKRRT